MTTVMNPAWIAVPVVGGKQPSMAGVTRARPACRSQADLGSTVERGGGVLTAIVMAVLSAVVATLLPAPVEAGELPTATAIYGIGQDQNIYVIDPLSGQVTGSTSTGSLSLVGVLANAVAFDRAKAQLYFMGDSSVTGSNNLYYWDQASNTLGQVGTTTNPFNVSAVPNNAAFYDGKFWFIGTGDQMLHSATINYTAGLPSGMSLDEPISIQNVTGQGVMNPKDIEIDPVAQILYGSDATVGEGATGAFFTLSLASLGPTVNFNKPYDQPAEVGLQLAFNKDYSILHGQDFATGTWYEVGTTASGTFTPTGGSTVVSDKGMRDLAGGVQAVPEPGTLALAGCGIATAGVSAWRRRHRRRRDAWSRVTA